MLELEPATVPRKRIRVTVKANIFSPDLIIGGVQNYSINQLKLIMILSTEIKGSVTNANDYQLSPTPLHSIRLSSVM